MSIKSIWRWFVGDDEPLGPESERGLFDHFNRPESLPWPPRKSLVPLTDKPKPRQFRVSALHPETGERASVTIEESAAMPTKRGSAHGEFRISTHEDLERQFPNGYKLTPFELKPTVGYYNSPPPRDYPNAPTIPVPYAVRPHAVTEALKLGDTHPDVYEYLVHLESHFARTHHHGK